MKLYHIDENFSDENLVLISFVMNDLARLPEIQVALNKSYDNKKKPLHITARNRTTYDPETHSIGINFEQIKMMSFRSGASDIGMSLNRAIIHEIYHAQDIVSVPTVQEYYSRSSMSFIQMLWRSTNEGEREALLKEPIVQRMITETGAKDLAALHNLAISTPPPDKNKYKAEVENPAVEFSDMVMGKYYMEDPQKDYENIQYRPARLSDCFVYRQATTSEDNELPSSDIICPLPRVKSSSPQR